MAQLRTSFMQTCNSTSSIFSSMSCIVSSIGSLFNNDENQDATNIKKKEEQIANKTCRSLLYFNNRKHLLTDIQRSVNSLINLNINSLNQLMDNQSSDFKGSANFVHALQIQNQCEEETKIFESLETLQSLNIENNQLDNFQSWNSTRIYTDYVEDNNSEFSQVQSFQI